MAETTDSTPEIWKSVLTRLTSDERITPQLLGFISLVEPKGVMAGTLYLEVPNELTRGMLEQRIRLPLLNAISGLSEDQEVTNFAIVVNPDIQHDSLEQDAGMGEQAAYIEPSLVPPPEANTPGRRSDSRLNPKYNFDNFVIGGSNRFAHAAAVAVAEAPAKASNNRSSVFQSRYRDIDILLIDDIQFLQGKDSTQEAFFHTFNTLHDHNKQVVITSDLPPKALTGFEDRMRSRFEWGLITDVQAPDLETRIAILRKSEKLQVENEILEYMASKVSSNIRELEGTLIRVTAFASLNRQPVDLALVQTVLKDLITLDDDNVIAPVDIINHTAEYFKLTVDDLYGSSRSQAVATARQIAMYLCREMTNLSLPKIGQLFGNRDHTTVMYANKKITELMKERRSIYNQVTELTSRIKQNHRFGKN
jgi:chromosomal replication initiator protein